MECADLSSGFMNLRETETKREQSVLLTHRPRRQRIALPQCLEARLQTRPIVALAGRLILVEVSRFDAGGEQRIALQVERLTAVGLGDAHVADQHGLLHKRANT